MAYVTIEQLSARLGTTLYARLTDRVNGTIADSAVAQQLVHEAEAEANSYFAVRHQTPVDLDGHPELADIVQARVLDLAEWAAWKSTPFVSDPPQRVHQLYAAALTWFQEVAAGIVLLPSAVPLGDRVAEDDAPRFTARARAFTADELDGL